jgi:hypothetical protein
LSLEQESQIPGVAILLINLKKKFTFLEEFKELMDFQK